MSYTAVDSEVLFWFVVALTVLLGMLISVVVRTPPGTVGSPQPPGPSPPAAPRPGSVRWPQAAGLADAAVRPARAGYRPRHAGGMRPGRTAAGARRSAVGTGAMAAGPGRPGHGALA